jgi:hypothetical protein
MTELTCRRYLAVSKGFGVVFIYTILGAITPLLVMIAIFGRTDAGDPPGLGILALIAMAVGAISGFCIGSMCASQLWRYRAKEVVCRAHRFTVRTLAISISISLIAGIILLGFSSELKHPRGMLVGAVLLSITGLLNALAFRWQPTGCEKSTLA